jgi:fructosamine-3-kinase
MFDKKLFSSRLSSQLKVNIEVKNFQSLTGGDINDVYQLDTSKGLFCIKINDAKKYPNLFEKEAKGLDILRQSAFTIPKVIHYGILENQNFLLLEFIGSKKPKDNFWEIFGQQLAQMHQITQSKFGLDHSNFIGSLLQTNDLHKDWIDFFFTERIIPQIDMAIAHHNFEENILLKIEKLYQFIETHFPEEPPALLHGDLWSGNYMIDSIGLPALIDPAVYYGHREMDIAMTLLFGGFNTKMYEAYQEIFPLQKGWEERVKIWQLYPLLVHVNLFGGGYIKSVKSILDKF